MAVPSTQDIQEQIRQQQLVGMNPASQANSYPPMPSTGNYGPYVPQIPYPVPSIASNVNPRATPVNVGKISLLGISFSLMLLGAFTFLGGFFLGIWVARPQATQPIGGYTPLPQTMSYAPPHMPHAQQQRTPLRDDLGRDLGYATKATITSTPIRGEPIILSPLIRAAQEEVGKQVGQRTETYIREGFTPSYTPTQISPTPTHPGNQYAPQAVPPVQLPVITPQSEAASVPFGAATSLPSQETDGSYTIQLGEYASAENANALVNHMQALNYPSQITEGKAVDGSKIYYVHSGYYKDYTTALNAVSQFTAQNIPGAIIVKISQQNTNAP